MATLTGTGWWRPDALLREVGANLWARRHRHAALAGVVATVIATLLWADVAAARTAIDRQRDFLAAGGTVVIVERDQGDLDAGACAALSRQPYVVAAGGLTHGQVLSFDHAPGTPFRSVHVVGDLLPVLAPGGPAASGDGLVLPAAAAAELGATAGSRLGLHGRVWTVAAVVRTEPRVPTIGRSVLLPGPAAGGVGQCWVEFHDGSYDEAVKTLPTWFAADRLSIMPLLERNAGTRDPGTEWAARPTRHGWLAAAALIAAFALLLVRQRRPEMALYLLLGTSRVVVAVLQTAELYAVVLTGGLLGMLWGTAAATVTGHAGGAALGHGLRAAVLGVTLALAVIPALAAWLVRTDLVAMLKERPG